jgi:hypothetical protein
VSLGHFSFSRYVQHAELGVHRWRIPEHPVICGTQAEGTRRIDLDPTSATLVRKSAGAVDRFEGLAEFVGQGSVAMMVCGPAWISMVR